MAGIYIHIPFCKQACHYCDFHFSTSLQNKDAFLNALKKEIVLQKEYFNNSLSFLQGEGRGEVSTVYFGGGTPSLLSKSELIDIFDCLKTNFQINDDAEIEGKSVSSYFDGAGDMISQCKDRIENPKNPRCRN